jgi:hypothetical protein
MNMVADTTTPLNKNFLSPLNFDFSLQRAPHLNFFIQSINLPGVSFMNPLQPTPFSNIPMTGDRLYYDDLNIVFKVDEDLQNYLEIYTWLSELGFPADFNQYQQISSKPITAGNGLRSDITLLISNGIKVANFQVNFRECIPVAIGPLQFATTDDSINYMTCSATFRYIFFEIEKI